MSFAPLEVIESGNFCKLATESQNQLAEEENHKN
jgi:hypothetical protein